MFGRAVEEAMGYCACGNVPIYWEESGTGPNLLLVSGLGGGTWSWYGQVPFFERHYRTITFDNRGAGRSGMPPGPYSIRQFANDTLCLLDSLNVVDVFVAGLSMGGMIAQELALMAPRRVRALLLGCTHFGGELRIPPDPDAIRTLVSNGGLTTEQIIDKNLPLFFSEDCRRSHPELIASYRRVQLSIPEQPLHAFEAQLKAIQSHDCSERFPRIEAPTLLVTGSQDILVPRENTFLMAEKLPHAEVVVIPGAGHALHVECCDELNEIAHHFFQAFVLDM